MRFDDCSNWPWNRSRPNHIRLFGGCQEPNSFFSLKSRIKPETRLVAINDPVARLRADLGLLLDRTDVESRRDFGKGLGWSTGEEMIRLFLAGKTDISLAKAGEWARRCGATLRAVSVQDPWVALDLAIDALPAESLNLGRNLRALVKEHSHQQAATNVERDIALLKQSPLTDAQQKMAADKIRSLGSRRTHRKSS